jgi:hypothetical protein
LESLPGTDGVFSRVVSGYKMSTMSSSSQHMGSGGSSQQQQQQQPPPHAVSLIAEALRAERRVSPGGSELSDGEAEEEAEEEADVLRRNSPNRRESQPGWQDRYRRKGALAFAEYGPWRCCNCATRNGRLEWTCYLCKIHSRCRGCDEGEQDSPGEGLLEMEPEQQTGG